MASYQAEVLTDTPILYYRLDQVGFGTDNETVPDLSGNGLDATLHFSGSHAAWGHPSPIETDASSKEFWGYTNAGIYGFSGVSHIGKTTESAIEIPGDSTVEGWLRPMDNIPVAGDFLLFGKRSSFGIGLTFSSGTRFCAFLLDSAGTLFKAVDTSFLVTDYIGTSFYVRAERLGNALSLYVNRTLRQTTTITSGLPTKTVGAGDFTIHPDSLFYLNARYDEVAFYDYALGNTRGVVHYEAALNTLNSSATITVRVPVTLDTDAPEPVNFPFAHNWTEPISGSERVITEHLSWKTNSNRSQPDYEQRVNARPLGPRRSLEYAITPTTALAKAGFQRALWQPAEVYKLPIWTDWMPLTGAANATDTTLDCDTTLRDFEIGSGCAIASDPYDTTTFQWFTITSRSDTQLGISPAVTRQVPSGFVVPVRLACLPDEESQFESYVIDRETGALAFEILDTQLSTRRVTTYSPTSTYQPNVSKPAVEVFGLDSARFEVLEQSQFALRRRQSGTGLLTGNDYYRGVDTVTATTVPVRVVLVSRETLSGFYGWLEARQGRQNPVWIPSRESDLTLVVRLSNTTLKINSGYLFYNLHYGRRDIQITFSDGTVANRRITAVADNGDGTETITVATLPAGTITKLSWLRFCVAPDAFQLNFHRDLTTQGGMIVECAWEFTELLTTP